MKKILISAVILLLSGTVAMASMSGDRAVTFAQLPQQAQQFIKKHFASNKISYAKQDTDLFDGDYEVYFTEGNKVEFNKKGEWKDVECKKSEVPAAIIPQGIKTFVSQNHQESKIIEINRDTRDYEIKLSNGIEMTFNLKGDFIRYDD